MSQYLIDPFGGATFLQNKIFEGPYDLLRQLLRERDIALDTYDMGDLTRAEKVLCFNYSESFVDACVQAGVRRDQLVLFMFEPPTTHPWQYKPSVWSRFGCVFTWRDDLVDGNFFHKLRFPQGQKAMEDLPLYASRRFLTLINANKYSYVENELYSLRRQAIRFFERSKAEFDLYGFGWEKGSTVIDRPSKRRALRSGKAMNLIKDLLDGRRPYPSFRGSTEDKYETLSQYRFNLCFENEQDAPGFLTEKLFDALFCEAVPIYLGAPNVDDYVPRDCFIDFREFSGFPELLSHLLDLDESDYRRYVAAGRRYLESDACQEWRPDAVFSSIVDVIAPAEGRS